MDEGGRRTGLTRRSPWPAITLLGAALLLTLLAARSLLPAAAAPSDTAVDGLTSPPGPGPHLVYSSLEGDRTSLWAVSAADPSTAVRFGLVRHRGGYGIRGSLSPDGALIAYTVARGEAGDPSTNAALGVLRPRDGAVTMLAEGVDLHSAPVWSPDGAAVVVRRTAEREDGSRGVELIRVEVDGGDGRLLAREEGVYGLYPFAYDSDGRLYYGRITPGGTDVRVTSSAAGAPVQLLHASDGIAREFRLRGASLLYSELAPGEEAAGRGLPSGGTGGPPVPVPRYRLLVADLLAGSISRLAAGDQPVAGAWSPDRGVTAAAPGDYRRLHTLDLHPQAVGEPMSGGSSFVAPAGTAYFPLAWAPDGRFLAAREVSPAGAERLVVLSQTGDSAGLPGSGYKELVGWLP